MKNIVKAIFVLLIAVSASFSQQAWKVSGNILGTPVLMTGALSTALADTASCDTTNTTTALSSAVLSNSVYLISGKSTARFGWVVIDTAKAGTTTTAPTAVLALQGSLDGTTFVTLVDSISYGQRFYTSGVRTGGFQMGYANLSTFHFPYYRLHLTPSGTLGTVSVATGAAQIKVGKFRFVIIP